MSIRKYTKNDLPTIFEIYDRSKLDELKYENKVFTLLPLEEDEVRLNGLLESNIFLYQKEDLVVAYGATSGNEIRALFVHPECRGEGIGKALSEFLMSYIQGRPYLYVARSNQPAKLLYQRCGFVVTDTFETTYNNEPVIAQKMVCTALSLEKRGVS